MLCAYCGTEEATTLDHVPPKLFLQEPYPLNLVTVPACLRCNKSFQKDDEYTRLILSVDLRAQEHPAVQFKLPSIIRSLQKPEAAGFAKYLANQTELSWVVGPNGMPLQRIEVALNRVNSTGKRMLQGLYFHETGLRLSWSSDIRLASKANPSVEEMLILARPFQFCTDQRSGEIGPGFSYGVGFAGQYSIWMLLMFGYYVWIATTPPPKLCKRILTGRVSGRFGAASGNLATVQDKILARTKLSSMAPGTLNVTIPDNYIVHPNWTIEPDEYFTGERLKLQHCRVRGHRMIIMRPESHELPGGIGANVLELISPIALRADWGLKDGDSLDVEVEGDAEWWAAPEPE